MSYSYWKVSQKKSTTSTVCSRKKNLVEVEVLLLEVLRLQKP